MRRCLIPVAALALVTSGVRSGVASAVTPARAAALTCGGHPATIVGTTGRDTLEGTPGNDVIMGLGGRDEILGSGGDDIVCGGRGADAIYGGAGDDRLFGGLGGMRGDHLDGGAGNDLEESSGVSVDFVGGDGNDRMVSLGDAESAYFHADAGDDTMATRLPTEQFTQLYYDKAPHGVRVDLSQGTAAGWGQDTLRLATSGMTVVIGTPYDDALTGSGGPDRLEGGGGIDTIKGLGGDDVLGIEQGTADAGPGDDSVYVGTTRQTPLDTATVVHGGDGDDSISDNSGATADQLYGDAGDDEVWMNGIAPGSDQVVDGGTGRNALELSLADKPGGGPWQSATLDLAAGTLVADGDSSAVTGFSDASVDDPRSTNVGAWTIEGTAGPNLLAGDSTAHYTLDGLGGDDRLFGSSLGDTLDGGPGDDSGDAGDGVDDCISIETPTRCEAVAP